MKRILKRGLLPALLLIAVAALTMCTSESKKSAAEREKGEAEAHAAAVIQGDEAIEGLPTVIDFYATWCGPCQMIAPVFDNLKEDYEGKVNFKRVDVDEDAAMAEKYKISAMPTFVFLNAEGEETDRLVGADEGELKAKVKALAEK